MRTRAGGVGVISAGNVGSKGDAMLRHGHQMNTTMNIGHRRQAVGTAKPGVSVQRPPRY